MRAFILGLVALGLTSCTSVPDQQAASAVPYRMTMPLHILRAEGEAPRLSDVELTSDAGDGDRPVWLRILFNTSGDELQAPRLVQWSITITDFCRDEPSVLSSYLVGPDGQEWRGSSIFVPAGPDHPRFWSAGTSSSEGRYLPANVGLNEAAALGGIFTLQMRDSSGAIVDEWKLDTLTPQERDQAFAANLAKLRAPDSSTLPVTAPQLLVMGEQERFTPTYPPRPCPTAG